MSGDVPPFRTARQLMDADRAAVEEAVRKAGPVPPRSFRYEEGDPVTSAALVVRPELDLAAARSLWNAYLTFRDTILSDPACYDEIGDRKEMNRTGATRLAVPFGLSIEDRGLEEGAVQDAETGTWDYRFRVRVRVSKGQRFVDGIGSCRLSEIDTKAGDLSRREHFALTKAWTRAAKRAIADILGGTEAD